MSSPSDHHRQPNETRLDALLDALEAGATTPRTGDPELDDLLALARAVRADDPIEWPDDEYPDRLTSRVFAELKRAPVRGRPNGVPISDLDRQRIRIPRPNPSRPAERAPDAELAGERPRFDIRHIARVAAVVTAFAVVTLIIAAVFRGFDGNGNNEPSSAGGFVPGDVAAHPPQLAIAMLPDPSDADPDIYLISPDGATRTNLTDHLAADAFPAWSPDGHKLAFVSNRAGPEAVYILDITSGDLRELYAPALEDNLHLRNLVWSPDGESIALMRVSKSSSIAGGTLSGVVVVDVESGDAYPVEVISDYPAPAYYAIPAWSPDGRWLLFEGSGTLDSRLLVVDTHTPEENPRVLDVVADIAGQSASWASTGEIAIADASDIRILRFNENRLEFEDVRRFTPHKSRTVSGLAWSPDGSQLLFSLNSAGSSSLWMASIDGAAIAEIPESVTAMHPAWSSDGSQIAFLSSGLFTPDPGSHDVFVYDLLSDSIVHKVAVDSPHEPFFSPIAWRPGEILPEDDETVAEATPSLTATAAAEPTPSTAPTVALTPTTSGIAEIFVEPGSWFCSDTLRMEAGGFPQDAPVTVAVRNLKSGRSREVGITPRANPDGEFTAELPISLMYPECEAEAARPEGLRLEVSMTAAGADGNTIGASVEIRVYVDTSEAPADIQDDPRVQQAIQEVRDFLGDQGALFTALPIEEFGEFTYVTLEQRDPNGPIPGGVFNSFVVEVNHGAVFIANLAQNSETDQPPNPIDVEQARAVAAAFHAEHDRFDGALTVVDEQSNIYINESEQRYDRNWQLESNGVWLPSMVQVGVSLETGLVVNYMRYDVPYDGPLTPEVTEAEARQAAEQIIAEDPDLAGATISESRLEVWYSGPDDTIEGRSEADPVMDWRLAWTFTLVDRPGPDSDHLLLIDALTGQKLEPGG